MPETPRMQDAEMTKTGLKRLALFFILFITATCVFVLFDLDLAIEKLFFSPTDEWVYKDVWLWGLQDGMSLDGRYVYNESVKGGGFGEGGTADSEHIKAGQSRKLTRVYPRNEKDDPIAPGTGVAAHLATSICEKNSLDGPCKEASIGTITIMAPSEGDPTIRVDPGKKTTD